MLTTRLIACFDVVRGRITKGRKFQDNIDVADAAEMAAKVYEAGIDELIFFDILASAEKHRADIGTIQKVARQVFVPLTIGGGIANVEDMHAVLDAGAEKVSLDSMAVRNPEIIRQGSEEFGRQCIVLSMQVKKGEPTQTIPSGYEVAIDGARVMTGLDAVEWAKRGEALGAGEICVNSIDQDGTHAGYDLTITRVVAEAVNVPVIASGGAGTISHVADAFTEGKAAAAIVSSLLYSPRMERTLTVGEMKAALASEHGLLVRRLPGRS